MKSQSKLLSEHFVVTYISIKRKILLWWKLKLCLLCNALFSNIAQERVSFESCYFANSRLALVPLYSVYRTLANQVLARQGRATYYLEVPLLQILHNRLTSTRTLAPILCPRPSFSDRWNKLKMSSCSGLKN